MDIKEHFKQWREETPQWDIAITISEMLKKTRLEASLSQYELAKKMHTKQPAIARAEKSAPNFVPTLEFIERWARACGRKLKLPEIV